MQETKDVMATEIPSSCVRDGLFDCVYLVHEHKIIQVFAHKQAVFAQDRELGLKIFHIFHSRFESFAFLLFKCI